MKKILFYYFILLRCIVFLFSIFTASYGLCTIGLWGLTISEVGVNVDDFG